MSGGVDKRKRKAESSLALWLRLGAIGVLVFVVGLGAGIWQTNQPTMRPHPYTESPEWATNQAEVAALIEQTNTMTARLATARAVTPTPTPTRRQPTVTPVAAQVQLTETPCYFNWATIVDDDASSLLKAALDNAGIAYKAAQVDAYGEYYHCNGTSHLYAVMESNLNMTLHVSAPDDAARGAHVAAVLAALRPLTLDKRIGDVKITLDNMLWYLPYADALALTEQGAALWQSGKHIAYPAAP